jgi:hypothetical protein
MDVAPGFYVLLEDCFVERFPCKVAYFSACGTLSSKDPEPPRKAPNLSPKPSPKRAKIGAPDGDRQPSAEAKAGRSSVFSDGWRIEESRPALRADGGDEAPHTSCAGAPECEPETSG